jgi:hypothetical protein
MENIGPEAVLLPSAVDFIEKWGWRRSCVFIILGSFADHAKRDQLVGGLGLFARETGRARTNNKGALLVKIFFMDCK